MENNDMVLSGKFGIVVETSGSAVFAGTGRSFGYMLVLEAATFNVFTEENATSGSDVMTGFAIPAGTVLRGAITAFQMASGKVRCHYNGTN